MGVRPEVVRFDELPRTTPTRTNVESPDPRVRKLVAPLLERGYDVLDV